MAESMVNIRGGGYYPVHTHSYNPDCWERRIPGRGLTGVCIVPEDAVWDPEVAGAAKPDPDPFAPNPVPASGLADTGKRVVTATGAVRERAPGKGRFDLISPVVEERLAKHMEAGAIKYGDGRNWEAGLPLSFYVDAARRHLGQFLQGQTDEDHLAAVLWNAHCLLHTEEMIRRGAAGHTPALNDLPGTRGAYAAEPSNPTPGQNSNALEEPPPGKKYTHWDGKVCRQDPKSGVWRVKAWATGNPVERVIACPRPHPRDANQES